MSEYLYGNFAPGLTGCIKETEDLLIVATVTAHPPGEGHCSRWLDSLPTTKTIIMLKVINLQLQGMLERRGFYLGEVMIAEVEPVPAYIRPAKEVQHG